MSTNTEKEVHLTKNRIGAVDISRLLAALLVCFAHLHFADRCGMAGKVIGVYTFITIGTLSPIFFLFAGFFACRNLTWGKAFNNALWCIIPYFIWNTIALLVDGVTCLSSGAGIIPVLDHLLNKLPLALTAPMDSPLWFMRNLIFLFLFSPIIFKASKLLFPLLILAQLYPETAQYFGRDGTVALYSLYYFSLGCFLRSFPKEWQGTFIRFYSPKLLVVYYILSLFLLWEHSKTGAWYYGCYRRTLIGETVGLWMFYQTARWLEVTFPRFRSFALKWAPLTFFVYAAHWILWMQIPESLKDNDITLIFPFLLLLASGIVFTAMKRYARPLLHAVAHYKLRPDDLEQANKAARPSK